MRKALRLACLCAALTAGMAVAQDLSMTPRPMPRPVAETSAAPAVPLLRPPPRPVVATSAAGTTNPAPLPESAAALSTLRPLPRPASLAAPVPSIPAAATTGAMLRPVPRPVPRPAGQAAPTAPLPVLTAATSIRPPPRPPAADLQAASAPAPTKPRGGLLGGFFGRREKAPDPVPADGYVCGDPDILGQELAPVTSSVRGCGIAEPVRVTSVDDIRLTTPATIDCKTARALKSWINEGLRPAFGEPEVVELRIAASYVCRPRNNVRGAKISEHGRGRAIDISGFILSNGRELSVSDDYNRTLRRAHKAACGIFGTTLGPGSDGYHEDHLHFDTSNLDRPYCR